MESTINTSFHTLVPEHQIATDSEVKTLLETFKCSIEQIPVIYSTDPALATLNARVGDVIKINRISPITGKPSPYFRVVIEAP